MRRTYASMLVKRGLELFARDEWKIRHVPVVNPRKRIFAETDTERREILIHPKIVGANDPPLSMSVMHELINHIVLQYEYADEYDENDRRKSDPLWWERTVWRQLPQETRDQLAAMVSEPTDE